MTMSPEEMVADAARRCGVPEEELRSYSFPKMFGSAAGPFAGIRRQTPTWFRIEAFEAPDGKSVLYCGGEFWKVGKVDVYVT